jgi:hypothetical protein
MKKVSTVIVLGTLASMAWLAGCAAAKEQNPPAEAAPPPPVAAVATSVKETPEGGLEHHQVVTLRAKVVGVDQDKRTVTLRGHDGRTETYEVDESVKNFPQIHKGDELVVKYYRSVAVRLKEPSEAEPSISTVSGLGTAAPGQKPAAVGAQTITITAKVQKVDKKKQIVTLKGPRGKVVDVEVQDPSRLEKVKKGDLVEITYTEALAISVEEAPKQKHHHHG